MHKQILLIVLIISGFTFMSCSYSSSKMKMDDTESVTANKVDDQEKDQATKLMEKYERRGIEFTSDQKKKITEIVDEIGMGKEGASLEVKKQLRRKIRTKIENEVLTAAQKKLAKKKN